MCNAEDDLDNAEYEIKKLHDVIAELKGTRNEDHEALFPLEEVIKLPHSPVCFTKYAGCVCIKRFADYVITPNPNKDEY